MAGGAGLVLGRTWADSLRRLNRPAVLAINRNGARQAFDRRTLCRQTTTGRPRSSQMSPVASYRESRPESRVRLRWDRKEPNRSLAVQPSLSVCSPQRAMNVRASATACCQSSVSTRSGQRASRAPSVRPKRPKRRRVVPGCELTYRCAHK